MKFQALAVVAALQLTTAYAADHNVRRNDHLNRRQDPPATGTTPAPGAPPATGTPAPGVPTTTGTGFVPVTTTQTTTSLATGTAIPPLESISSAMATRPALFPTNNYPAGATPPVSGAPPLPTSFVFTMGEWPDQDKVPPTDTPEVQEWLKELEGHDIPDLQPTIDGTCGANPEFAADAANRGWWTCGGHIRSTDIVACPDKNTWGVSFDDGPSPFTQYLLNYLEEKDLTATFFVVGSRVIERPTVLVEEYMKGHEISVHSWSHRALTKLTTAEVVAELGWTRKAIKRVLGVTPTTMRPPFGDIDDRVRAISLAMGMVPIMWSRLPGGGVTFDTNDWRVADGKVSGPQSFATFQEILTNSSQLDTGFIVLQHDLYESTVDLAVGYTLPYALQYNPKLSLQPIGQCAKMPTSNLYLESNQNASFPVKGKAGIDTDGDGKVDVKSGDNGKTTPQAAGNGASRAELALGGVVALVGAVFAGLL